LIGKRIEGQLGFPDLRITIVPERAGIEEQEQLTEQANREGLNPQPDQQRR
jgi:hypothetical protein